jgi:hypothetical protein
MRKNNADHVALKRKMTAAPKKQRTLRGDAGFWQIIALQGRFTGIAFPVPVASCFRSPPDRRLACHCRAGFI